jgi:hypothetical protein
MERMKSSLFLFIPAETAIHMDCAPQKTKPQQWFDKPQNRTGSGQADHT